MSFKIVQTEENGNKMLSVVPTAWENNGTLFWPKSLAANKLIQDGLSVPLQQGSWKSLPCVKKRENFLTYSAATAERDAMVLRSDSEATDHHDDTDLTNSYKRFRSSGNNRKEIGRSPQTSFNSMMMEAKRVEQIQKSQEGLQIPSVAEKRVNVIRNKDEIPETQTFEAATDEGSSANILSQHILQLRQPNSVISNHQMGSDYGLQSNSQLLIIDGNKQSSNEFTILPLNNNEIYEGFTPTNSSTLSSGLVIEENELKLVLKNQNDILDQQKKILEELAKQRTTLEFLCEIYNSSTATASQTVIPRNNDNNIISLLPIDTIDKLREIELFLIEEKNMAILVNKMSAICGSSGKMEGINCCYALIDSIFNRQFLTKFSWSGGSRNTEGKVPFKNNKNIMKAFHEIIVLADAKFSEMDCEGFFKSIIKNAKRRALLMSSSTEKRRSSSGKKRPKNLKYKIRHEHDDNDKGGAGVDDKGEDDDDNGGENEGANLENENVMQHSTSDNEQSNDADYEDNEDFSKNVA